MADDYASRTAQLVNSPWPRMATPDRVYGYPVRRAFPSESDFFSKNTNVAGMAAEDNAVVLNPYSPLYGDPAIAERTKASITRNEAARLYMREKGYQFDFDLTPQQQQSFAGTVYGDPANADAAKASIIARALSGDPSAGDLTPQQRAWVDRIGPQLRARER